MDLNDFWQENKRWVLCCVAGLVVFFIAREIVHNTYVVPVLAEQRAERSHWKKVYAEFYDAVQLTAAKKDRARLQGTLAELREAMHHELDDRFNLAGKGDPELHVSRVYAAVRDKVFDDVDRADIEFEEKAFTWPPETVRENIQRRLVGVSLVEHTVGLLLSAHKKVTDENFEAIGLRSILDFKMDRVVLRRKRSRSKDGVKAADLVAEIAVKFKFSADNATVHQFLENCRAARPRVTLGSLQIVENRRSGDPLLVSGDIRALTIKPPSTAE